MLCKEWYGSVKSGMVYSVVDVDGRADCLRLHGNYRQQLYFLAVIFVATIEYSEVYVSLQVSLKIFVVSDEAKTFAIIY